eukprot:NODE_561_length_6036_cov_1.205491.p5 type:complete len:158 gc:universal NODE_561_length_6036_cov_1.205491:3308-3781(+)
MYISIDPGIKNLAIVIADIDLSTNSIAIYYHETISIKSKDLFAIYDEAIESIRFLFTLYDIKCGILENQPRGTKRSIYNHNLLNTNIQAVLYTFMGSQGIKVHVMNPKTWHKLLSCKRKTMTNYRRIATPMTIQQRQIIKDVHQYDCIWMIIALFSQ